MLFHLEQFAMSPGGVLLGLLIGAVGSVIGIVGFRLTLQQIKQVRSVADAQQLAIADLKIRFSQFDVIQECVKAERALGDIKTGLMSVDGEVSLASFDAFAVSLVSIREGCAFLSDEITSRLSSAIANIDKTSELTTGRQTTRATSAKQAATFREYHGLLVKIRSHVQQEQQI